MVIKVPRSRESTPVAVTPPSTTLVVRVCRWVWMVVRFVCVIRAPVCPVCPVCVPCASRLPPVSCYRYRSPVLKVFSSLRRARTARTATSKAQSLLQ